MTITSVLGKSFHKTSVNFRLLPKTITNDREIVSVVGNQKGNLKEKKEKRPRYPVDNSNNNNRKLALINPSLINT